MCYTHVFLKEPGYEAKHSWYAMYIQLNHHLIKGNKIGGGGGGGGGAFTYKNTPSCLKVVSGTLESFILLYTFCLGNGYGLHASFVCACINKSYGSQSQR